MRPIFIGRIREAGFAGSHPRFFEREARGGAKGAATDKIQAALAKFLRT